MNCSLSWPYKNYRSFQEELVKRILEDLEEGKTVALKAPTGYGKTIVVLYSSLLHAINKDEKIVYLVRTRNEINPVLRELYRIHEASTCDFAYAFAITKYRLCYYVLTKSEEIEEYDFEDFSTACKYMRRSGACPLERHVFSPFSSINEFIEKILSLRSCPWYAIRSIYPDSRVIVATYPYLFNRFIRTLFLLDTGYDLSESIVVIDEAHNLELIASSPLKSLSIRTVLRALEELKLYSHTLTSAEYEESLEALKTLASFLQEFREIRKSIEINITPLLETVSRYNLELLGNASLRIFKEKTRTMGLQSRCYFCSVLRFISFLLSAGEEKIGYFVAKGRIEAKPLIPLVVTDFLKEVKHLILMSGTLPEKEYLRDVYGIPGEIDYIQIPKNCEEKYFIVPSVSSKYEERNPETYAKIAIYVIWIRSQSFLKDIIMVVYPSYQFMKEVLRFITYLEKRYGLDLIHIIEDEKLDLGKVNKIVSSKPRDKIILHCVAGGKFTEGIEITEEKRSLISAIVIAGLPFPEPDDYLQAKKQLYEETYGKDKAFDYLLLTPMIVKVEQALGRAKRFETDTPFYFILDRRTLSRKILSKLEITKYKLISFPPHWRKILYQTITELQS